MDKASTSTSARHRSDRGGRTNRGLTCANCRLRKTRCDGSHPRCKTCEVYKDDCRYEKAPPMSQIIAMAKRLQELEQANAELETALRGERNAATHQTYENFKPLATVNDAPGKSSDSNHSHVATGYASTSPEGLPALTNIRNVDSTRSPDASSAEINLLSELSLDENGKLCYHGPTSAVHAPPIGLLRSTDTVSAGDEYSATSDARSVLTSSALEARAWEDLALGNATLQTSIPQHIISKLVQIHWSWIAPMFMWVYRPAFMRDMATGGPYYSPFLLTVLCAHAARFDDARLSDILISRARMLLGNEIHQPSSIPTVQGLLQLSARDLAYGSISQSWLYSGMAFRMVSDLGLHHSTGTIAKFRRFGAEETEIRRRLFWSCYFWDKAISLYLGRMPVLQEVPVGHTPVFYDSAEHENWSPFCGGAINLSRIPASEYPPMRAHAISCFENSCKLSVIINDIIMAFYSRHAETSTAEVLNEIRDRLTKWRENTPEHLKYSPENLPSICPPPHILSQNLLYYTTVILLHRPFYANPIHHNICRMASDSIEKLLLLLEQTFGFNRITYLMSYCIYTGASVITQDTKSGELEAAMKMQTFLRALREGIATCPVVQRSLDIITRSIGDVTLAQPTTTNGNEPSNNINDQFAPRNYLPAFPYRDLDMSDVQDVGNGVSSDFEGLSFLYSFPETFFDQPIATEDWFSPS